MIAAAAAVSVPVVYLIAVRRACLRRARIYHGKPPATPKCLPDDVKAAPEDGSGDIVLSHERLVSISVPVSGLRPELQVEEEGLDVVLTPYVQSTMKAWLDTSGGRAVKKAIDEMGGLSDLIKSFSPEYIDQLNFNEGDLVNGVYKVAHRGESADGGERVEFRITHPPGWLEARKGPDFNGVIVAGWEVLEPESGKEEEEGVNLVFINETWLWRKKGSSKTVLEWNLGRWFHTAMSGWLVGKGIDAVIAPDLSSPPSSKSKRKAASAVVTTPASVVASEKQPAKEETEGETETETETETSASEGSDDE